jgi:hypothetical protein
MCKIVANSVAALQPINSTTATAPKQNNQLAEEFDAWFETLNSELNMDKQSPTQDYLLTTPDTFSFEMLSPLPSDPFMDSMPSPPETILLPETLVAPPSEAILNMKPIEIKSMPRKANNVKRATPDEPITEALAKKRQKQNEAAKRCRQKRLDQLMECQNLVKKSEQEKFELSVRLAVLEKERAAWLVREAEMNARLDQLKAQLDESHMILMSMKRN